MIGVDEMKKKNNVEKKCKYPTKNKTIEEIVFLEAITELELTIEGIESIRYEIPEFHDLIVTKLTEIINHKLDIYKNHEEYVRKFHEFMYGEYREEK
jgi:hypothetical protein